MVKSSPDLSTRHEVSMPVVRYVKSISAGALLLAAVTPGSLYSDTARYAPPKPKTAESKIVAAHMIAILLLANIWDILSDLLITEPLLFCK
jgi:hypothetical protein